MSLNIESYTKHPIILLQIQKQYILIDFYYLNFRWAATSGQRGCAEAFEKASSSQLASAINAQSALTPSQSAQLAAVFNSASHRHLICD
ncbi:hypothetical protein TMatcc_004178 [Talaromyces marneffei ATCC 18224]